MIILLCQNHVFLYHRIPPCINLMFDCRTMTGKGGSINLTGTTKIRNTYIMP